MDESPELTLIPSVNNALFDTKEVEVPTRNFFLFELDNELYAVELAEIELVMKIPPVTAVPNAPVSIMGIFHLRGRVIVVLDLLKRMGIHRNSSLVPYYLFVASQGKNHYGILVDRTHTVVRVPLLEITPLDPMTAAHVPEQYVKGRFLYQEKVNMRSRLAGPEIMIAPISTIEAQLAQPTYTPRPVIILDLERVMNEEEVRAAGGQGDISAVTSQGL